MSTTSSSSESNVPAQLLTREHDRISLPLTELKPVTCPHCQHPVSGDQLDIENTMAHCLHCGHVFGFSYNAKTNSLQPEQLLPDGVEILKLRSELDIRLKWKNTTSPWGRKFFTLFTVMWNLMLLPFVLTMIFSGQWGVLLFVSLHLLVGLGFIWYLSALYVNETTLSITPDRFRVRSGPVKVPFSNKVDIEAGDVDQLYVSRYMQGTQNGVPKHAFALYAILKDGSKKSLLRGMNEATQHYLEQEIEHYLGIQNRPVEGEEPDALG